MSKQSKSNIKLLAIITIPIIGLGIFLFIIIFPSNNQEISNYPSGNIPIPKLETDTIAKSKIDIYLSKKKKDQQNKNEQKNSLHKNDFYSFDGIQEKEIPVESVFDSTDIIPIAPITNKIQRTSKPKKIIVQDIVEAPIEKPKSHSGFGIVRASNSNPSGSDNSNNQSNIPNSYFSILLEENIVIKNNSNIVFVLMDNIWIDGKNILKNSYLFGKAKESRNTFDVEIYEIKATDGTILDMRDKGYYIYDEKYSRGLQHEGNVNQATKETLTESGSDATSEIARSTGVQAVNAALSIFDKGVKNVVKHKENTVSLLKGYRLYVKKNE